MERGNLSKENDPTKGQPEMLDAIKCRVYQKKTEEQKNLNSGNSQSSFKVIFYKLN